MERSIIDRRKGPDTVVRLAGTISSFSSAVIFTVVIFFWILIAIIFIIINAAGGSLQELFEQQSSGLPENWKSTLFGYSYYLFIFIFAVCSAGLILNSYRHQRKTDTYKWSLIFFGILSLAGIIIHLIVF